VARRAITQVIEIVTALDESVGALWFAAATV
jgi:hypothetical protein